MKFCWVGLSLGKAKTIVVSQIFHLPHLLEPVFFLGCDIDPTENVGFM